MRKRKYIFIVLALLMLAGCATERTSGEAGKSYEQFNYTHYSSGGTPEEYTAVILFEQSCSTFTEYQVAFSSCTCRDPMVNYLSVCYVELLNTKQSSADAAIRTISFGDNMGLYGDSNPNYYIAEYTEDYMDENFIQRLVGATKSDFDSWQGYGSQLSCIDADAVSGATVTTGNVSSMLKALFEYHAKKYYPDSN